VYIKARYTTFIALLSGHSLVSLCSSLQVGVQRKIYDYEDSVVVVVVVVDDDMMMMIGKISNNNISNRDFK